MSRITISLKEPTRTEAERERATVAALLSRLPYPTRLAIKFALDVQDHIPTDYTADRATERLRDALREAGVSDA